MAPILLLFDIDGTLMSTSGAGMRALGRAVRELYGFDFEGSGIKPDGRTDPLIVSELLIQKGIPLHHWHGREREVWERYSDYLHEELDHPDTVSRLEIGVQALLEALEGHPRFRLGVLTGNLHVTARRKLAHFQLERYFPIGAYACDCAERGRLGPIALERARRHYRAEFTPARTWLIGDTDRDISAARAFGARVLAVATGNYSLATLEEFCPDLALADLSDTARVLAALEDFPGSREPSRP